MTTRGRLILAAVAAVVVTGTSLLLPRTETADGQTVLHGSTARHTVRVVVDPAEVGTSAVHIEVSAPGGVTGVRLEPAMPHMGHAFAPVTAKPVAGNEIPGRYRVSTRFDMPGTWELTVVVDDGQGAQRVVLPLVVTG
ncbi:FixH family protein [Actinophytocola sediminis]